MGAGKRQLQDLIFLLDGLYEIPAGPLHQPVKSLLNGSTTLWDRLNALLFLLGHMPLLLPFVYFFLMSEISEELLAHLCRPPATTA